MSIQINFDNALRHAMRLQQLAGEHRTAATRLEAAARDAGARWRDPAGDEYVMRANALAARMRRSADSLSRLGSDITGAARAYKATEEANQRAAKKLQR